MKNVRKKLFSSGKIIWKENGNFPGEIFIRKFVKGTKKLLEYFGKFGVSNGVKSGTRRFPWRQMISNVTLNWSLTQTAGILIVNQNNWDKQPTSTV